MPRIRMWVVVAAGTLLSLGIAGGVWASPAGEGAHGDHGITLFNWPSDADPRIGLIWLAINFFTLLYLINRLIIRNLVASNHERHDSIRRELEDATAARGTAEALVREFKAKIDTFSRERDELLAAARIGADLDRKRILAEAEAEAAKIVATAKATAAREAELLRHTVESEVVGKAIGRARELLLRSFTAADQRRMVDGYASEIATTDLSDAGGGAR